MSSPPDNSAEYLNDSAKLFDSSSDEEVVYSYTTYNRVEPIKNHNDIKSIQVRLPQKHSLWAHLSWNAGVALSDYLEATVDFTNKTVLELGSGAGLPCYMATLNGGSRVVMTDYPDKTLIDNLQYNRDNTLPSSITDNKLLAVPHLWGNEPETLNQLLDNPANKYDIIILSDLIFNHQAHFNMLKTCAACLSDNGIIYVSFTHHRPHRREKDLNFFTVAAEAPFNFIVEKFMERLMKPMFEVDLGCEVTRSTVNFYTMRKQPQQSSSS
ncbi:hypothetical protein SAMD00019534_120230 [Acytostelium subglobosum LB1]|uniref:hypothetical protein n=1 Tax=Acytostelium subglobosum LB1 TaxID=1410327 RepID=UPI000644FBDD|nr:hypothetical protein SAMD00019534_120230 [Acytostelium subglobosum LB1]GAM28847.1 hypothetical protein SAMD00019534_120230 [Acytostelium subglobosum LB1]|eukprot:XP_012748219.1 hypothetical protein SAMD00019534_120230 [Acytostelium subglobosum LB1]